MFNLHSAALMSWKVGDVLQSAGGILKQWGAAILVIVGVIVIIASVINLAKHFMSHGQSGGSLLMPIIGILVGGAIAFGGWSLIADGVAQGGVETLKEFGGGGTILFR